MLSKTLQVNQSFPNSPPFQGSANLSKEWAVGQGSIVASLDEIVVGERVQGVVAGYSEVGVLPHYHDENARISYKSAHDQWEVSAFVRNIRNEVHQTVSFPNAPTQGNVLLNFNTPRWVGVEARYTWK